MKKLSLILLAVVAIFMSGCQPVEGTLTWRVYSTPSDTEEAYFVADKIDNVMAFEYGDLGEYEPGYRDGKAVFAPKVTILGWDYDDIYDEVALATFWVDEFLEDVMDYGELTQCRVVVTLFVDNKPTEMLNKEYVAAE